MSLAQGVLGAVCKPVSRRTQEIGCWIISDDSIGQLIQFPVFWHFDVYPARGATQAGKGPRVTVVESLDKVWLMTIEKEDWRPRSVIGLQKIEFLVVTAGQEFSAQLQGGHLHARHECSCSHSFWS
jgi:hypothetical protein